MKTIRPMVFETNSSSTHCVNILTEEELDKFMNHELAVDSWSTKLATVEDVYKQFCTDIETAIEQKCVDESIRDRMPTCEEFGKWIVDSDNMPDDVADWRCKDPIPSKLRECFDDLVQYGHYFFRGYCDYEDTSKEINGTTVVALSIYRGE